MIPLRSLLACLAVLLVVTGCDRSDAELASRLTGGNPHKGRAAIEHYGCGSCHTIPGIRNARGLVGPPLVQLRDRVYIAGRLTNSPDHLIRWIENPQAVDPQTAMPNLGVTEHDARDIASFLYTVR